MIALPGFQGRSAVPDQLPSSSYARLRQKYAQQHPDEAFDPEIDAMIADFSGNSAMYFPQRNEGDPITVSARAGWSKPVEKLEIYFLEGECAVQQGKDIVRGDRAVIWIDRESTPQSAAVYLESADSGKPLLIELSQGKADALIRDQKWVGTFRTSAKIDVVLVKRETTQTHFPPIYERARETRFPHTAQYHSTQLSQPVETSQGGSNFRKIQFFQRSDTPTEMNWKNIEGTNRSIGLITNGFTLLIEGVQFDGSGTDPKGGSLLSGDTLDISADRAVIWTANYDEIASNREGVSADKLDIEIYLEGNIVFLEGNRSILAKKMYYDVKNRIGYILDAELLSPAPGYDGLLRLKAEAMRQIGPSRYAATNSYITTSRLGEPSYRIQSQRITLDESSSPLYDKWTGSPIRDPKTGLQATKKKQMLTAENNVVCIGSVPIFYWPWLSADLQYQDPFLYIRSASLAHNQMFGTQIRTGWNPYQIFNIKNRPEGTDWDISLDYLSARGLGHGTNFTYSRGDFFGIPGPTAGMVDYWGIYDSGKDNLGYDRRELQPETSYRYRAFWRHRQELRNQWVVSAELGKVSDRNFMEQYFENEWDTLKNQSTDLELKKTFNNSTLSVFASYRMDDFVTDTNWFPRADHFWLGQSLLGDTLTWYEHTRVGLAQFETTDAPQNANNTTDPHNANYFQYLPWELNAQGVPFSETSEVISTKHELDLPFSLGPLRVVPYALGELAHWGKDVNGDGVQRVYYQAGIRLNLPMWKLMPGFASRTWYANGLAHKVDFDGELSYAGSNVDWDQLVQYEALDDHSVQASRRRFAETTFKGNMAPWYDERYYAVRSGLAGNVTSPVPEAADDLSLIRFGMKNRWQTKRGPVGNRRIIDWITFDVHANIYPEDKQNFGETLGLMDYDFRWHVGDRFAILSSGIFDVFDGGQKIVRLGGLTERPGRGSLFLGVDHLEGPFTATYLNLNISYQMNEKYSGQFGTSFDLHDNLSAGTSVSIRRLGESFAWTLGFSVDPSRDVWGVNLSFQPVFLSKIHRQ